MKYSNLFGLCIFVLVATMIYHGCNTTRPCDECPSYTKHWVHQSDSINKELSLVVVKNYDLEEELAFCREECDRLSEENQFYSSMLGEVHTIPGGANILDSLFNKHN